MPKSSGWVLWGLHAFSVLAGPSSGQDVSIPSPEPVLGFRPGADFELAEWSRVVDYFHLVDRASDRVVVRTLGESTEGRPFLAAVISAPETIRNEAVYRERQHQLADPRRIKDPERIDEVIRDSKTVVLITCTIHSSEVASTLMSLELLHELAVGNDPSTLELLDRTILLLVPSVNPDGVDKVAEWYKSTLDKPWEGSGMPRLYHAYAGHDTNRDWFMLNLQETRLLTHLLYREWFPTITYDVHQMGSTGARLFVPPFFDPVNPNLDPRLSQGIALIGAHMASDLARAGKKGVLTNAMYDNWWNGGNRTVPQRHNMVGVLTEAASVRLATPIFLTPDQLRGATRGFRNHEVSVNFADPWPGGWWRLRDIVDYELICARSILTLAARYRDHFQSQYLAMADDSIRIGREQPPFGWVVPADQIDPGRAADLVSILHATGIDVHQADEPMELAGRTFPSGSWILPAAQPFRPHLKDMMERQTYPNRLTDRGEPETPYDVAGWTLPLQMGVEAAEIGLPFQPPGEPLPTIERPTGAIEGVENPRSFAILNRTDDDLIVLNELLHSRVPVRVASATHRVDDQEFSAGTLWFEANERSRDVLANATRSLSTRILGTSAPLNGENAPPAEPLQASLIGVYQPWVPSMDEGWTRLVLENYGFRYESLHNAEIRSGDLRNRFDVILLPSVAPRTIREGYREGETAPEFVGGLGRDGSDALMEFVRTGGRVVCLEQSCLYAISEWDLPVKEVLSGLSRADFYGPGSILRVDFARGLSMNEPFLTYGVPQRGHAYFHGSLAFDVEDSAYIVARYASHDVLASGWLHGARHIEGKAALVSVPVDEGKVILFGFPPQHRGQSRGTFRLLFNALLGAGLGRE